MLADAPLIDDTGDRLGFKAFADAIAGIIDSPRTSTPLTMVINAKWGAGKSTLGHMVKKRLETKPAADGYAPHVACWFNAWMHDDATNLAASLAAEVAKFASGSRSYWRRIVTPLPSNLCTERIRRFRKWLKYFVFPILTVLLVAAIALRFGLRLPDVVALSPHVIGSLAGMPHNAYAVALIVASILVFKLLMSVLPVAKSVSEFVRNPEASAGTASMQEVRKQLGKLIRQATPRKSKFVIFIDDLDRCKPPRSVDILEAINQLFDQVGVVVVIMADMQVVAKCADLKYRTLEGPISNIAASHPSLNFPTYGWNYIQKIIQVQFDLPVYSQTEIRRMLEALVKEVPQDKPMSFLSTIGRFVTKRAQSVSSALSGLLNEATGWLVFFAGLYAGGRLLAKSPFRLSLSLRTFSGIYLWAVVLLAVVLRLSLQAVGRIRDRNRRRAIDRAIRVRIQSGEHDFSKVQDSIRQSNATFQSNLEMAGLLRERLQKYLEDESELQREAEDEVMRHLEPMPRHAKRVLNRLRLLLFVAHERKMFGGEPHLSPRHIGKWAVLCERWPELAQLISTDPRVMRRLEDPKRHGSTVRRQVPLYRGDRALRKFCLFAGEVKLAPIIQRLVAFAAASVGAEKSASRRLVDL